MWDMWEFEWFIDPNCTVIKVLHPTPGGEDPPLLSISQELACASTTRGGIPGKLHQEYEDTETTEWGKHSAIFFHGWILKPVFLRPFVVCWACGCLDTTQNSVGCSMGMRYIASGFWLARCCVRYDLTSDLWRNYNLAWCHKNVGKKPLGYIFTQFYTESFAMCAKHTRRYVGMSKTSIWRLQPHTCPSKLGALAFSPAFAAPKPRGYAGKKTCNTFNPSFHSKSCLIARPSTPPHPQEFMGFPKLGIGISLTWVIALRDSPVSKFAFKNAYSSYQNKRSHWIAMLYMEREDDTGGAGTHHDKFFFTLGETVSFCIFLFWPVRSQHVAQRSSRSK